MNRGHFMTAAVAASLGLTAGLTAGGSPEVAAAPHTRDTVVELTVPNDNAVITAIWEKVDEKMCPLAEAKAGLGPGECTIEEGAVTTFARGASNTRITSNLPFAGTWSKNP